MKNFSLKVFYCRAKVSLVIQMLVWRRLSSKELKKMSELKDVWHKLSTNDDISVRSVRWKHNGRGIPSNYDNVCSLEVTKKDPVDEYHCTVEFSNKKSHMYVFIVKFTGSNKMHDESVKKIFIFTFVTLYVLFWLCDVLCCVCPFSMSDLSLSLDYIR